MSERYKRQEDPYCGDCIERHTKSCALPSRRKIISIELGIRAASIGDPAVSALAALAPFPVGEIRGTFLPSMHAKVTSAYTASHECAELHQANPNLKDLDDDGWRFI